MSSALPSRRTNRPGPQVTVRPLAAVDTLGIAPRRTRPTPRRRTTMSDLPYDRPTDPAKRHSAALTDGPDRAGARAMLKAVGFTDEDLAKPIVGVATTWIETMPCNYNQRRLAEHVKEGRSEEHTSELQSRQYLVCRLLLEKKKEI